MLEAGVQSQLLRLTSQHSCQVCRYSSLLHLLHRTHSFAESRTRPLKSDNSGNELFKMVHTSPALLFYFLHPAPMVISPSVISLALQISEASILSPKQIPARLSLSEIRAPTSIASHKVPSPKGFCSSQKDNVLGVTGKTLTWMQQPSGAAQAGIRERQRQHSKRTVL